MVPAVLALPGGLVAAYDQEWPVVLLAACAVEAGRWLFSSVLPSWITGYAGTGTLQGIEDRLRLELLIRLFAAASSVA